MLLILMSWIYITLICLIWGNQVLKLITGIFSTSDIDFPVICFIGLSVLGIISFYLSLVVPIFAGIKLVLQIVALFSLMYRKNRSRILFQLKKAFSQLSIPYIIFLIASLLMVLFISSAPIIHPDTLHYHAFSTSVFDKQGTIIGIANIQQVYGFQSMWFAATAFFDFSYLPGNPWFPLNSCVMGWLMVFLVSKAGKKANIDYEIDQSHTGIWYLILMLFCILSWTQVRLTAASLSPDFIVTISILLALYFYNKKAGNGMAGESEILASFFSFIAISIKLSAIPILIIPIIIIPGLGKKKNYLIAGRIVLLGVILLMPLIIRNYISTGYPFYPSSAFAIFFPDWKMNEVQILNLQHYITTYARNPVPETNIVQEYSRSFSEWIPLWWKHLYMADKALITFIAGGLLANILFFGKWKRVYSRKMFLSFALVLTGTFFWFLWAPDPRFGTGFLLPLIYFLYLPFFRNAGAMGMYLERAQNGLIKIVTVLIIIYTGYRAVYFFQIQLFFRPCGMANISTMQYDCDVIIKRTILDNTLSPGLLPDSCIFFRFRGTTVKQGFKPVQ